MKCVTYSGFNCQTHAHAAGQAWQASGRSGVSAASSSSSDLHTPCHLMFTIVIYLKQAVVVLYSVAVVVQS